MPGGDFACNKKAMWVLPAFFNLMHRRQFQLNQATTNSRGIFPPFGFRNFELRRREAPSPTRTLEIRLLIT